MQLESCLHDEAGARVGFTLCIVWPGPSAVNFVALQHIVRQRMRRDYQLESCDVAIKRTSEGVIVATIQHAPNATACACGRRRARGRSAGKNRAHRAWSFRAA